LSEKKQPKLYEAQLRAQKETLIETAYASLHAARNVRRLTYTPDTVIVTV
jgi:hypothetical protein